MVDYYPLLSSAEWIEWHLWHQATLGYHLVNIFLHVVSALLVWRLLDKLGLRLAWLGGLLFAIHPVQVESVAWMAELKNTLSLPPFLLAMCAYIDFDEQGKRQDYFLAIGLFISAMLCKTTMAMFPHGDFALCMVEMGRRAAGRSEIERAFFRRVACPRNRDDLVPALSCRPWQGDRGGRFYFANGPRWFGPFFLRPEMRVGAGRPVPVYPKWTIDPPTLVEFLPWLALVAILFVAWSKRMSLGAAHPARARILRH